jgi:hypothetical protein
MQFGARLLSGAICGAAIGSPHHAMLGGLLAGIMARYWPPSADTIRPPLSWKTPSLSAARG